MEMIVKTKEFKIGGMLIGGRRPLVLFAGLCVIESEAHTLEIAAALKLRQGQPDLDQVIPGSGAGGGAGDPRAGEKRAQGADPG